MKRIMGLWLLCVRESYLLILVVERCGPYLFAPSSHFLNFLSTLFSSFFVRVKGHYYLHHVKHFHHTLRKELEIYNFSGSGKVLAHFVRRLLGAVVVCVEQCTDNYFFFALVSFHVVTGACCHWCRVERYIECGCH